MSKGYTRRWNEATNSYERRNKKTKQEPDPQWTVEPRPKVHDALSEEKFSSVLIKLKKPNYNRTSLSPEEHKEHIQKGTKGANDLREEKFFDDFEPKMVYKKITKVPVSPKSTRTRPMDQPVLREIDATRPNNLYLTFILRELWAYDISAVEKRMKDYEKELKKAKHWDTWGWDKSPPPEKTGKKGYNLKAFIEYIEAEESKKTK